MAYEQRDMSGTLFKNDKKQEGDKMPDYKGNCLIKGEKWEIGAWIKPTSTGGKLLSLSFKPPFQKSDPGAYVKPPQVPKSSDAQANLPVAEEDVPF